MKRRPWLVAVAVLAVFSVLAAACGDDTSETTTTAVATTTTAGPTTTGATSTTAATTTTAAPAELLFDTGVTLEPCPDSPNPENGCIYLGNLSDFSGAFATQAPLLEMGHQDFWARVNAAGGIGPENGQKFDVIITADNTGDTGYDPTQHVAAYEQIRGNIAALAETLGTTQTLAALSLFDADNTVAAVSSWYSGWSFPEIDLGLLLETGSNYCFDAMNGFDFAVSQIFQGSTEFTYAIIGFAGDYGGDTARGVYAAAQAYGMGAPVAVIEQIPMAAGGDLGEAIATLAAAKPSVIFVTTGPVELATLMGGLYAAGHQTAVYIGAGPTWNTGLLNTAALVPLLQAAFFHTGPWLPVNTDTPGHAAMRWQAQLSGRDMSPITGVLTTAYSAGWIMQYNIKAVLEQAIANGDLTRAGIRASVAQLTDVNYEGMLPNRGYDGLAADQAWRTTSINKVVPGNPDGLETLTGLFMGPTAAAYDFSGPCYNLGDPFWPEG